MKNRDFKKAFAGEYSSKWIKTSRRKTQLNRVMNCFWECPKSMRMVELQTEIMRPNICRYIKLLIKSGQIQKVKYGRCQLTGRIVGYYSTNPLYFTRISQLRMF